MSIFPAPYICIHTRAVLAAAKPDLHQVMVGNANPTQNPPFFLSSLLLAPSHTPLSLVLGFFTQSSVLFFHSFLSTQVGNWRNFVND
jgi:hypothetical protein